MTENSRSFYRLRYPTSARPSVEIEGVFYAVAELSEQGIRVALKPGERFEDGLSVSAVVTFHDQGSEAVDGVIVRRERGDGDESEAVLELSDGISLKRMLAEQAWIRSEYPRFIDPADLRSGGSLES